MGTTINIRDVFAESSSQVDLMILLLHQNLADLPSRILQALHIADAIAVIANGFVFIIEIVPEHVSGIFRCADWLGGHHRHFAEIIYLPREDQGMIEFLLGVGFELGGDIHVFGAAEHLRINYVMR